ncbi:MAG: clostripain-related cysteine peptidase [candidate division WOR-3 bacterium]|nr:clostripain-related cysteine peptidase [candidate division WOR-3 bacterium]
MRNILLLLILPVVLSAREWTVLVYMVADNSLSDFADSDLVEMKNIGSDENFGVLVQVDKPHIGAYRYYVGKDTLYKLAEMGMVDMCDWHTLKDFMLWGISLLPAKRYFLILWDHGTGWTLAPKRTFGSDWSAGTQMSIANGDLNKALKGFYEITGRKFNIIGFDACNMQQIEIINEIKDYGKVCIAPQTIWPINGFPYEHIFYIFKTEPRINEVELGKRIVEFCRKYYSSQPSAISLVDLEKIEVLKRSLKKNIETITQNPPTPDFKEIRKQVQTVSLLDSSPGPQDDYIDLGDFLRLVNQYFNNEDTKELFDTYNKTVVKAEAWGTSFRRLSGITIWFPDRYIEFKNIAELYYLLKYSETRWINFLNWFYGEDDIRPAQSTLYTGNTGKNNDFRLYWTKSFDLAPVFYSVLECRDTILLFADNCEDSTNWVSSGFTLVNNIAYEGNRSFFSGNSSNLNNSLYTKHDFYVEELGLLDFYLYYNTEDMVDSFIVEFGSKRWFFYGRSESWQNIRIIVPPGSSPLRFYYRTNGSVNNGGVYIDRIRFYNLSAGRFVRYNLTDTTIYIFNKLRGNYYYGVYPRDQYNNEGNLSNLVLVNLENYAVPYSIPNPFVDNCEIVLDYPAGVNPEIYIYSITGRLIKKFSPTEIINKRIYWNGDDENGHPAGSGLYFVMIKSKTFNSIGKIARQR